MKSLSLTPEPRMELDANAGRSGVASGHAPLATRLANAASQGLGGLTPREREVALLLARGLRNREIARELAIAEGTVKVHLHNAFQRLGVRSRLELALRVERPGFE